MGVYAARGISCVTDKLKGGLNSSCSLLQALCSKWACGNSLPVKPSSMAGTSRSRKKKAKPKIHQDRQRKQHSWLLATKQRLESSIRVHVLKEFLILPWIEKENPSEFPEPISLTPTLLPSPLFHYHPFSTLSSYMRKFPGITNPTCFWRHLCDAVWVTGDVNAASSACSC